MDVLNQDLERAGVEWSDIGSIPDAEPNQCVRIVRDVRSEFSSRSHTSSLSRLDLFHLFNFCRWSHLA